MAYCSNCKAPLSSSEDTLCVNCKPTKEGAVSESSAGTDILSLIAKAQAGVSSQREEEKAAQSAAQNQPGVHIPVIPAPNSDMSLSSAPAPQGASFGVAPVEPSDKPEAALGSTDIAKDFRRESVTPAQREVAPTPKPNLFAGAQLHPTTPVTNAPPAQNLFGESTPPAPQQAQPAPQEKPQSAPPAQNLFGESTPPAPQQAQPAPQEKPQSAPPAQNLFGESTPPAPQQAQPAPQERPQGAPIAQNLFGESTPPAPQQAQPAPQAPPTASVQDTGAVPNLFGGSAPAAQPPMQQAQQSTATFELGGNSAQQASPTQHIPPQAQQPFDLSGANSVPNLFDANSGPASQPTQFAYPLAPPLQMPEQEYYPRKSGGKRAAKVLIFVAVFLVLTASLTLGMLYFINMPSRMVDSYIAAIEQTPEADTGKLATLTTFEGVEPSAEGWEAFVDLFEPQDNRLLLQSQLNELSSQPPESVGDTFPAIGISQQDFFLFIKKYGVTIQGVSMLAPGATEGTVAYLNGVEHTGVATAEGVLYEGIMPGRYECTLVPPGTDPSTVQPITVDLFMVAEANVIEGTLLRSDITIENCLSDDAVIYVNDVPVQERPIGGVVTIPRVALGSTIRILLTQEGQQVQSTVVYESSSQTTLRFENYENAPISGASDSSSTPSASSESTAPTFTVDEINTMMSTFYTSYLNAINDQSVTPITLATDSAIPTLQGRITSDANAEREFQFTSVACDEDSIVTETIDGEHYISFNMSFSYTHRLRGQGEYEAGSNRQSVQLIYEDGTWMVNNMVFVSDGDFDANRLADF